MHAAAKNSVSPHKNTAEEGREGGIPPADLPAEVSTQAGPREFRSDIFKQAPPHVQVRTSSGRGS
jgi:hypothetical protein